MEFFGLCEGLWFFSPVDFCTTRRKQLSGFKDKNIAANLFFTFIQLFVLFDKFKPKSSRVPSKWIPNNNTKGLYLINFDAQVQAD